jgi:hypothetical protein
MILVDSWLPTTKKSNAQSASLAADVYACQVACLVAWAGVVYSPLQAALHGNLWHPGFEQEDHRLFRIGGVGGLAFCEADLMLVVEVGAVQPSTFGESAQGAGQKSIEIRKGRFDARRHL